MKLNRSLINRFYAEEANNNKKYYQRDKSRIMNGVSEFVFILSEDSWTPFAIAEQAWQS